MGAEALEAAVFNWAQKRGVDLESLGIDMHADERAEGRIVCKCFSLSEPYIRRKIKELNLRTIAEITNAIKAGGACMSCHHVPGGLQDLLDETWGAGESKVKALPQLPVLGAAPAVLGRAGQGRRPHPFALPVRQENRKGHRRVRSAHAEATTAETWRSSTSRTRWSIAGWPAPARAAPAPGKPCGCWSSKP